VVVCGRLSIFLLVLSSDSPHGWVVASMIVVGAMAVVALGCFCDQPSDSFWL
jgi:hypothetical protein